MRRRFGQGLSQWEWRLRRRGSAPGLTLTLGDAVGGDGLAGAEVFAVRDCGSRRPRVSSDDLFEGGAGDGVE